MQPPPTLLGEGLDGVPDDAEQRLELGGGAVQVVGGEQPQRPARQQVVQQRVSGDGYLQPIGLAEVVQGLDSHGTFSRGGQGGCVAGCLSWLASTACGD